MTKTKTVFRWSFILIFILSSLIATLFLDLKSQALQFHNRDYSFYIQFAAKLLDPQLVRRFTINPDGFNYLGYVGTEGAASFQQSIHLEPIRYFYPAAFVVTGTPISLFAFFAALYFLPIIYIAYVYPVKRQFDNWFWLLFVLFYIFYPLTLSAIANDLRPRILMVPAFVLAFLAIHWQRNWLEKLAFFGLLLITREEAIILAAGLIAYDIFRSCFFGRKNVTTFLFIVFLSVSIWVQFRYFHWTGYDISQDLTPFYGFPNILDHWGWIAFAAGSISILVWVFRLKIWKLLTHSEVPAIGIFNILIMPPLVIQMIREKVRWFQSASNSPDFVSQINDLFFQPKNVLLFAACLLVFLQIWEILRVGKIRQRVLSIMAIILMVSALIGINKAILNVKQYKSDASNAKILTDLRAKTNRLNASILTDYAANQAFYDYENLYVFERLPNDILPGEERFYPANLPVLSDLIKHKVEWVAVGTQSKLRVFQLLRELQIEPRIIAENSQYVVLRLR